MPNDLSTVNQVEERGSMIEAAKEKLEAAKQTLDSLIQKASDMLKEKLNDAKQLAVNLTEKLEASALKATEIIYNSLHKILDKVSHLLRIIERT